MYDLPEPPATPVAGQATPTAADQQSIDRIAKAFSAALDEATAIPIRYNNPDLPSHKDGSQIGNTPPVPQPDSRIVPAWALGLAVGSMGVGAGSIGLGCAVWLACKGLSSVIHSLSTVTLAGVLTVAIPFAGLAMVATAVGGAISKAKQAAPQQVTNIRNGPTYEEHHTTNTKAVWNKTVNKS